MTSTRFVLTPENRSAWAAVQDVAACFGTERLNHTANPLFLHGPAGTGKTHLVSILVEAVTRCSPGLVVTILPAGDFDAQWRSSEKNGLDEANALQAARQSDLLIVEDVQHLCSRCDRASPALETFVQLMDHRQARQRPLVLTATVGPGQLGHLPARLVSRLAGGLVVGLEPLAVSSRLAILQDKAQRRQLAVHPDVLAWVARHVTGSVRALEGALVRLETLVRLHQCPLDVATAAAHFREQLDAARPTVERITQRVGVHFRVEPRQLQSRGRYHNVLLPRQIGMYLARQLTGLSLEQIGAYFGGRDHSTVLHACRKVEQALARDAVLSGTVRQLQADLA